jgi:AraC-like DNA-binding protein
MTATLTAVPCARGPKDRPFVEVHDAWTIALVRRGAFTYRSSDANAPHLVREGWLLLGRPGVEFECAHPHAGGDDCTAFRVPEAWVHEALRSAGRTRKLPARVLAPVPRVAIGVEYAMRARDAGADVDVDDLAATVIRAVLDEWGSARDSERVPSRGDHERVRAAVDLLEAHSEDAWPLSELAARVDASPYHFAHAFRAVTGTTPHQYLVGARLRRAAVLLLDTDRPVTNIAYAVGFGDLSNFIRTFRRELGASPARYRNRA